MSARIRVESFFDDLTQTFTHLVIHEAASFAVIIDPVLDFDPASGHLSTRSADRLLARVRELTLTVTWILETHAHADHLSAGDYLRETLGARIGIGRGILQVQAHFKTVFNWGDEFAADGADFDQLFDHGDCLLLGGSPHDKDKIGIHILNTPGHTPDSVSYLIEDALFVGDTFFAPDTGTARCDFPGGSAKALWQSLHDIAEFPLAKRFFLCHDYPPDGRAPRAEFTREEMAANVHLANRTQDDFVIARSQRDATLSAPRLLFPSLQFNIRAGKLPSPENNGVSYLKLPLKHA